MKNRLEYQRAWRAANREKILAYQRAWKAANPEKVKGHNAKYYAEHGEQHSKACASWYERNREKVQAQSAAWRENNRDRHRAMIREHYANNKHMYLKYYNDRRAVKEKAIPPWADQILIQFLYTTRQWISEETQTAWHVDHVIPLRGKRVTGLHVHTNLRIIPAEVNLRKGNRVVPQ